MDIALMMEQTRSPRVRELLSRVRGRAIAADRSVSEIAAMLPGCGRGEIRRALEVCGGQTDLAVDLLLSGDLMGHMEDEEESDDGMGSTTEYLLAIPAVRDLVRAEAEYVDLLLHHHHQQQQQRQQQQEHQTITSEQDRGDSSDDRTTGIIEREHALLERVSSSVREARFFCEGEEDFLVHTTHKKRKQRRWMLLPTLEYDMRGEQIRFHIAASQFHRTSKGAWMQHSLQSRAVGVHSVEYVVTPHFIEQFEGAKQRLASKYGWLPESIKPVMLFHGTSRRNIDSILDQGFLLSKVGSSTDMGYYGRGIYFSEYPGLSMGYARDCQCLLLCLVLVGKAFRMENVQTGCELKSGYDSHISPCGSEVVIFDPSCIMPLYVVTWSNET